MSGLKDWLMLPQESDTRYNMVAGLRLLARINFTLLKGFSAPHTGIALSGI
jgi:hypothetical protein